MAPLGGATRPTSDRVREAIFDILGALALAGRLPGATDPDRAGEPHTGPLVGCTAIDLFAGSGALGLEALSRGAVSCVFVESSTAARHALMQNVRALGVVPSAARVVGRPVEQVIEEELQAGRQYTLLFADPPYAAYSRFGAALARALPLVVEPGGVAVIETAREVEPQTALTLLTTRTYGDTRITILSNEQGSRLADEQKGRGCRTR